MDTPLLDIRNLSVDFHTPRGRVHALRDVCFKVPRGKSVGVVGESGSGKSTVIWAITQLLANNGKVTSGQALFAGKELLQQTEVQIRDVRGEDIAIVFQDPMTSQVPVRSYTSQMTDILYRRADSRASKKAKAVEMLRKVGVPDPEARILQYPHQFSGGMRQRAGIAMALLMDPMLLIADEPTTALDVTMEAQIIHLMRELQQEMDATILVVSHNLGLIAEMCDEVVVMYAGEVVETGGVHDIFYRAAHPYTRALLECDPARETSQSRHLPVIPGDIPDLHQAPAGCVFASRCKHAVDICRERKPGIVEVAERHQTRCHLLDGSLSEATAPEKTVTSRVSEAHTASGEELLAVNKLGVRFQVMGSLRARVRGIKDPYVDAVLDASLSLQRGETLGLVGESGSGKTTLGRAILGLLPAQQGQVLFKGQDLRQVSSSTMKHIRRDMAMMFQDPVGSLSPRRTVLSLITEPLQIHQKQFNRSELHAQAQQLCDQVRLPRNFLSRYPHELSGGQARRVGVARALALNPSLVIADEPTAGLDVSVQGEILNLMSDLQAEHGLGYLIISHNLPVIRHISDKLAIMYLGRLVEQGDSEAIFNHPAHPYTEALVNGVPQPDPKKRRSQLSIEGEVPSVTNRPSGCEFHTRCKYMTEMCQKTPPQQHTLPDGRRVLCHYPLLVAQRET